jgi:hypothetical protein
MYLVLSLIANKKIKKKIFTCLSIWVRKLVLFGEGRTQIEGVLSPGVSIWIPKTQVLYQGAEE